MTCRVLLVDDDESCLEVSRYNLEQAGFQVDVATDGEQGVSRFSPERHDLVVTDLRMPRASGMEVLAHVRAAAPEVPVVVVTAHGSVETAVEAMRAGASDFIEKPFGREVLLRVVRRALERRRLALESRAPGIQR